jgi:hypothetical protein
MESSILDNAGTRRRLLKSGSAVRRVGGRPNSGARSSARCAARLLSEDTAGSALYESSALRRPLYESSERCRAADNPLTAVSSNPLTVVSSERRTAGIELNESELLRRAGGMAENESSELRVRLPFVGLAGGSGGSSGTGGIELNESELLRRAGGIAENDSSERERFPFVAGRAGGIPSTAVSSERRTGGIELKESELPRRAGGMLLNDCSALRAIGMLALSELRPELWRAGGNPPNESSAPRRAGGNALNDSCALPFVLRRAGGMPPKESSGPRRAGGNALNDSSARRMGPLSRDTGGMPPKESDGPRRGGGVSENSGVRTWPLESSNAIWPVASIATCPFGPRRPLNGSGMPRPTSVISAALNAGGVMSRDGMPLVAGPSAGRPFFGAPKGFVGTPFLGWPLEAWPFEV